MGVIRSSVWCPLLKVAKESWRWSEAFGRSKKFHSIKKFHSPPPVVPKALLHCHGLAPSLSLKNLKFAHEPTVCSSQTNQWKYVIGHLIMEVWGVFARHSILRGTKMFWKELKSSKNTKDSDQRCRSEAGREIYLTLYFRWDIKKWGLEKFSLTTPRMMPSSITFI